MGVAVSMDGCGPQPPGVDESTGVPPAEASKSSGLVVRSRRPLDLETPLDRLDGEWTPNEWFFVRSHFGEPPVRPAGWSITCDGLVERQETLPIDEVFSRFARHERPAVLMCAGNGRALFEPRIAGLPWERGAVGQARWSGIRLREFLDAVGVKPEARHVVFESADLPPTDKTPPYTRSLPIERLLRDDVLLADRMNGDPLPVVHGGPVRLVVPSWTGNHWIKWIRRITLSAEEAQGFYQRTAYKMPTSSHPAGGPPPPESLVPVTRLFVKSLITSPLADAKLVRGRHVVRGAAWTGDGLVTHVGVRLRDDEPFRPAMITTPKPLEGAWVRFEIAVDLDEPGEYRLASRATDSAGDIQPDEPLWNKSGYLHNAIDPVGITVT